ncbi:hypothetical protein GCM10011409_00250 [Lentibacillus populi]|uniref:Uncharacterized protein n=1 Tax=Lentibacillus populi TaxID=1827502 RepID=A0A9W5TTR1_9BACI|nr:hypothetical protein [Lentibacillus populi]GGB26883.1 hypothetical protein GCM10011409_00250 [Lentibacillus populi]
MSIPIYVDEDRRIEVMELPSECGICHKNIYPKYLTGTCVSGSLEQGTNMELVFKCTNKDCRSLIVGYYNNKNTENGD